MTNLASFVNLKPGIEMTDLAAFVVALVPFSSPLFLFSFVGFFFHQTFFLVIFFTGRVLRCLPNDLVLQFLFN